MNKCLKTIDMYSWIWVSCILLYEHFKQETLVFLSMKKKGIVFPLFCLHPFASTASVALSESNCQSGVVPMKQYLFCTLFLSCFQWSKRKAIVQCVHILFCIAQYSCHVNSISLQFIWFDLNSSLFYLVVGFIAEKQNLVGVESNERWWMLVALVHEGVITFIVFLCTCVYRQEREVCNLLLFGFLDVIYIEGFFVGINARDCAFFSWSTYMIPLFKSSMYVCFLM